MVADAMRLWKEIPTEEIPAAMDEALIQTGEYRFKIGTVAKAYRDPSKSRVLELGAGFRRSGEDALSAMAEFDAEWEKLTTEEKSAVIDSRLEVVREAKAKIGGAA